MEWLTSCCTDTNRSCLQEECFSLPQAAPEIPRHIQPTPEQFEGSEIVAVDGLNWRGWVHWNARRDSVYQFVLCFPLALERSTPSKPETQKPSANHQRFASEPSVAPGSCSRRQTPAAPDLHG